MERSNPNLNPWLHMILKLLAHSPTMLKCSIQQYKRTKQQSEREGSISSLKASKVIFHLLLFNPLTSQIRRVGSSQTGKHSATVSHSVCLICPSGAQTNDSAPQTTKQIFFFDKGSLDRPKTALLFIPSLPLCNNPRPAPTPPISHKGSLRSHPRAIHEEIKAVCWRWNRSEELFKLAGVSPWSCGLSQIEASCRSPSAWLCGPVRWAANRQTV